MLVSPLVYALCLRCVCIVYALCLCCVCAVFVLFPRCGQREEQHITVCQPITLAVVTFQHTLWIESIPHGQKVFTMGGDYSQSFGNF